MFTRIVKNLVFMFYYCAETQGAFIYFGKVKSLAELIFNESKTKRRRTVKFAGVV